MPDLPWAARAEMEPGTGYLVMASHLPLKRITATPQAVLERRVSLSATEKAMVAARSLATALRPRAARPAPAGVAR